MGEGGAPSLLEGGSVKVPIRQTRHGRNPYSKGRPTRLFFPSLSQFPACWRSGSSHCCMLQTKKLLENRKDPPVRAGLGAVRLHRQECDFDGSRVGCAQVLRRTPSPTVHSHSVQISPKSIPFGPAGTHSRSSGWTSSSLPLYTMPVSAIRIPPSFLHMPYFIRPRPAASRGLSTIVAQPIKGLQAFVNDAAEAGQTQISLSLELVSVYGIAVPPMAADLSLVFHHGPTCTHCLQSICEAGPSTLVGWRCSSSRHNCPIVFLFATTVHKT
jgi:hypothetical protein